MTLGIPLLKGTAYEDQPAMEMDTGCPLHDQLF